MFTHRLPLKALNVAIALAVSALLVAPIAAAVNLSITVLPNANSALGLTNVNGVPLDAADGYDYGSLAHNGLTGSAAAKSEYYVDVTALFGRVVTVGEVESISYATKKASDHVSSPHDWYLNLYTQNYAGDPSSATWYGHRLGAEPYFAINLNEVVGGWNYWSTDAGDNQLRWFDSSLGYFGSYTDPAWAAFIAASSLGSPTPLAAQPLIILSVQTASSVPAGFNGQVDGLRVQLTDGSVATFNFEPHAVPANRDQCKKNGWTNLLRPNASPFSNQGDCVSFVNTGR